MARATVAGFGSVGLCERLKQTRWSPVSPGVKNFHGISIVGWILTHPEDNGYSTRYRFTIEDEAGGRFQVEGYGVQTLLKEIVRSPGAIRVLHDPLSVYTENKEDRRYVLTVEIIE